MVLLEKTLSQPIDSTHHMPARDKALEAAQDKALPAAPAESEVEAPPQYEEFVPGSSGDVRRSVLVDDLESISDVSSLVITVVPPTEAMSHPVMSVRSRSSPLARPDSSYSYTASSETVSHPPPSVRSWSSPSAAPSLSFPSASQFGTSHSPSSLRHDSGASVSEFGSSESSVQLASFQASPDRSLVPGTGPAASRKTLAQSRSCSLASLAPSIALAEKASIWKPGSVKKASKQARVDIFDSLRSLMSSPGPDPASILTELATHATAHRWSLQTILQEEDALLDNKTAVYWAVAKLGPGAGPDAYACARAILSAAAPLGAAAMGEVRAGALLAGDQSAWVAVRPWVVEAAWQDTLLLGEAGQADNMDVVGSPEEPDTFLVAFSIPLFKKRMKLKKRVSVDFFAKGRLFNFTFIEVPSVGLPKRKGQIKEKKKDHEVGSWVVSLSLFEPSPETPITARLVIDSPIPGSRAPVDVRISLAKEWRLGAKEESKKKITDEAITSLRNSLAGQALELDDSPYVDPEGSLQARLYIKLDGDEGAIIR